MTVLDSSGGAGRGRRNVKPTVTRLAGGGCFLLSAALIALSLVASDANADAFDEFRIPEHRVLTWDASLGSVGSRLTNNAASQQGADMLGGSLGSNFFWLSDSDPRRTMVSGGVQASGSRTRQTRLYDYPVYRDDRVDHLRGASEQASVRYSHDRYSGVTPVALTVDFGAAAGWTQAWNSNRREISYVPSTGSYDRSVDEYNMRRWQFSHLLDATIGAGVGRVRDATPVFDVIVLEQRLREAGVVNGPLGADTRQQLAAVLAMTSDYSSAHDRPTKALWQEIAAILTGDPAVRAEGLDPGSVQRAAESFFGAGRSKTALPASPVLRNVGTQVQVVLYGRQGNTIDRFDVNDITRFYSGGAQLREYDFHQSSRNTSNVADAFAGLAGEYHRPIGATWQIDASARSLFPLRSRDNSLQFEAQAGADWIIADRWLGSADLGHHWYDANRTTGPTADDEAIWAYGASVGYYLEDNILLQLSMSEQQNWTRGEPGGPAHRFYRGGSFSLTLSYRIAGRFFAPDYFTPAGAGGT